MPAGADVTVPVPVPPRVIVSANRCSVKVAVRVTAAVTSIVQVAAAPQPSDQPVKSEPVAGVAVSVTLVL